MPDYEPNVDAPAFYWAGEYDAQAIADATGASWAAPIFALNQPRVIDVAALCGAPPPSAPAFTTTDLVQSLNPFADNTALRQKLSDYVDAGLHRSFCTAVDVPPLDPIPDNPPPADLPPGPVPVSGADQQLKDIWTWTEWLRREILPRSYFSGTPFTATGHGSSSVPQHEAEEGNVWAAGIRFSITAKPDYLGRSNGGDFPVFYDAGWISMGTSAGSDIPIRVNYIDQVMYGHVGQVTQVYWNLPPNVELLIWPLYPVSVGMSE